MRNTSRHLMGFCPSLHINAPVQPDEKRDLHHRQGREKRVRHRRRNGQLQQRGEADVVESLSETLFGEDGEKMANPVWKHRESGKGVRRRSGTGAGERATGGWDKRGLPSGRLL